MPETPENPRLRPVEAFPARLEDRDVVCLRDPSGLSNSVLTVPRALAPILALFDGLRSLVDVQAQIMRECGELVLRSQLESMVEILDQHLFLEGPRVEAERGRREFRDFADWVAGESDHCPEQDAAWTVLRGDDQ